MVSDFLRQMPGTGRGGRVTGTWSQRLHIDVPLLIILVMLIAVGTLVLYSASGANLYYPKRQATFAGVGVVAMFVVAQFSLNFIQRWVWLAYVGGLVMLILVLLIGDTAKGAQRWIDLGVISFQPSEIIKICLPLMVASFLCRHQFPPTFLHICVAVVLVILPVGLILKQPDLGTSIMIGVSGLVVLFLAGLRKRYIFGALGVLLPTLPLIWFFGLHEYQRGRILTMLDPEADKLGAGWNIMQSMTAIGSGGTTGKGWMKGTQSHLDFLPESHTDFIVAVLAEEFGFQGVLAIVGIYSLLVLRGFWISATANSVFGRLVAGAITFTFFFYIFVNMGMVSGILPVVGVPLPLVSYGGTSLVSLFIGFGLLMAVSTQRARLVDR